MFISSQLHSNAKNKTNNIYKLKQSYMTEPKSIQSYSCSFGSLQSEKIYNGSDLYYRVKNVTESPISKYSKLNPDFAEIYNSQNYDASHYKIFNSLNDKEVERVDKRQLLTNQFNRDKKFSAYSISQLASLDDSEWQKVLDRSLLFYPERRKQFHGDDIVALAKLSDEQWDLINQRGLIDVNDRKKQFGGNELAKLSLIDDEKWSRVVDNSLIYSDERDVQFSGFDIFDLANMPTDKWNIVKEKSLLNLPFRNKEMSLYEINSLLNLDDNAWKKIDDYYLLAIEDRKDKQFDSADIINLLSLDDKHWNRIVDNSLLTLSDSKKLLNGAQILELASSDDKAWKNILDTNAFVEIKAGQPLSFYTLRDIADIDKTTSQKNAFNRLKKLGLSDYSDLQKLLTKLDFQSLFRFDDSRLKRIKENSLLDIKGRKESLSQQVFQSLLKLNDKNWDRVIDNNLLFDESRTEQFSQSDIANIVSVEDELWKKIKDRNLLASDREYTYDEIIQLANLEDSKWNYVNQLSETNIGFEALLAVLRVCYDGDKTFDKNDFKSNVAFVKKCDRNRKLLDNPIINKAYKTISKNLSLTNDKTLVNQDKIANFYKVVIANDKKTEQKIKNMDIASYKKSGIPLAYPREKYISDLNKKMKSYSPAMKEKVFNSLGISPVYDNENGSFIGYNGSVHLPKDKSKYNSGIFIPDDIYSMTDKFLMHNKVVSADNDLNKLVSSIIDVYPDFINLIGKQQNSIHDNSLDVHILSVFQNVMKNPGYDKLSGFDKTTLKLAAIFHDIGKSEFVIDDSHPKKSTMILQDILGSFRIADSMKNRVLYLVKNHHWFTSYNKNLTTKEEVAATFMNISDFNLAQMLTYSDMAAVNKNFKEMFENNSEKIHSVEKEFNEIDKSGNFVFSSHILNKSKIPTENCDGKTYKIFNSSDYNDYEDLGHLGFAPGTKKNDLRFLVHAIPSEDIRNSLDLLSCITNPLNQAVISSSFVSCDNSNLFLDREDGLVLATQQSNVASAINEDQYSGFLKDDKAFKKILLENKNYRNFLARSLCKELELSVEDYAILYRQFEDKTLLSQIKDNENFITPSKTISGVKLKNAIKKVNDSLLNAEDVNEVVVTLPNIEAVISKHKSLKEVPDELKEFANEKDLPIILI